MYNLFFIYWVVFAVKQNKKRKIFHSHKKTTETVKKGWIFLKKL